MPFHSENGQGGGPETFPGGRLSVGGSSSQPSSVLGSDTPKAARPCNPHEADSIGQDKLP